MGCCRFFELRPTRESGVIKDLVKEFIRAERLGHDAGEILVSAYGIRGGRDCQHGKGGADRLGMGGKLRAVHAGHAKIGQKEVVGFRLCFKDFECPIR